MKLFRLFYVAIACMACILESCSGEDGERGPAGADGDSITGPAGPEGDNGISCWDTNSNGMGDAEEDINQDGNFDALDCQGSDGANGDNGVSCWDLNGNGVGDPEEDNNLDGNFDAMDCKGADGEDGADGNANVTLIEVNVLDFSGSNWDINIDPEVTPLSDYVYLTFIRRDTNWYDVPGNLSIEVPNNVYCRRFINANGDILSIRFYSVEDNFLFAVPQGSFDTLRIFAIAVNPNQAKGAKQAILDDMKADGIDISNYYEVARYFGYDD